MRRAAYAGVLSVAAAVLSGCARPPAGTNLAAGTAGGSPVAVGQVPAPGPEAAPTGDATTPAPSPETDRIAQRWQMPWQMAPGTERTAREHRDVPDTTEIPGLGRVKATPRVLAALRRPFEADPRPNRAVDACRRKAEATAVPFGPATVEAVSRGPDRPARGGVREGLVEMRITYRRKDFVEVRQGTLRCAVDAAGRLVSATPIDPR